MFRESVKLHYSAGDMAVGNFSIAPHILLAPLGASCAAFSFHTAVAEEHYSN